MLLIITITQDNELVGLRIGYEARRIDLEWIKNIVTSLQITATHRRTRLDKKRSVAGHSRDLLSLQHTVDVWKKLMPRRSYKHKHSAHALYLPDPLRVLHPDWLNAASTATEHCRRRAAAGDLLTPRGRKSCTGPSRIDEAWHVCKMLSTHNYGEAAQGKSRRGGQVWAWVRDRPWSFLPSPWRQSVIDNDDDFSSCIGSNRNSLYAYILSRTNSFYRCRFRDIYRRRFGRLFKKR